MTVRFTMKVLAEEYVCVAVGVSITTVSGVLSPHLHVNVYGGVPAETVAVNTTESPGAD